MRCDAPEGFSLCFNGGTCLDAADPGDSVCECPANSTYVGDMVFFHNENCSLPSRFYLANLVVAIVTTIPCMLLIASRRKKVRGIVLRVSQTVCILEVFYLAYAISLFAQDGFYEAAAISFLGISTTTICLPYFAILVFLTPLLNFSARGVSTERQLKRFLLVGCSFLEVCAVAPTIIMLSTCRTNRRIFNLAAASFYFLVAFDVVVGVLAIVFSLETLATSLDDTSNLDKNVVNVSSRAGAQHLKAKLRAIKRSALAVLPGYIINLWGAILQLAWGSAPYYGYYHCIIMSVFLPLQFCAISQAAAKQVGGGGSSSKPNTAPPSSKHGGSDSLVMPTAVVSVTT